MNLSPLRALQRLRMKTNPPLSPDQARNLLSTITSLRMVSIEISVLFQSEEHSARLDMFLAGSTAPVFEKVVFSNDVLLVEQDVGTAAHFLPLTAAKGILGDGQM